MTVWEDFEAEDWKAITVKPPWAQAIAAGVKTVENRSAGFPANWRGPLLIHAGSQWSLRGARDPRILNWYLGPHRPQSDWRGYTTDDGQEMESTGWARGQVLAACMLVDVHPAQGCCEPWGESSYEETSGRTVTSVMHLVLDDIARVTPIKARGRLGLWPPDHDVIEHVLDELQGDQP